MKAELNSINTIGGVKFWGVRFFDENKKPIATYNIRLKDLKDLGVVQRLSDKSKLLKWLNSEEGQQWVTVRMEKPTFTVLGAFI